MTFSIIVPCYNLMPWIRQCLDSVLVQDYQDWECVVVDDESTDGSGTILDEYAKKDSRFTIIHQNNAGEGGARNSGLDKAKGEWVFFLDGDDLMLPNTLSKLAGCISGEDKIIRFGFLEFDDGGSLGIEHCKATFNVRHVDATKEINMSDFCTYVWQHIYRRSVIAGMQFNRYKRGCDRVFLCDVLLHRIDKIKIADFVGYGYRKRMGSAVNSVPSRQVLCDELDHRIDIMEMIDKSCKKVVYVGNEWLEQYCTTRFYHITGLRGADKLEVVSDWRFRLGRMRKLKALSHYGRFVAASCWLIRFRGWDAIVCYIIPRLIEGGSPVRWLKRKLHYGR